MKMFAAVRNHWVVGASLVAVMAGVSACSVSTPQALIEARKSYRQAESDSVVSAHAPVALRDARQTLDRAERRWQQERDPSETEHLAYLARQQVEIARSAAQREVARSEIARLSEERQQILINARTREAKQSEQQALAARTEAAKARAVAAAEARAAEEARQAAVRIEAAAEAARKREQQAAAQARESAAQARELEKQLAELQAKMEQTPRGLVLTLGDVLFEFDSADLKAGALRNLYPLVTFLKENGSRSVVIEGHTDNVGSEDYNLELSRRRAQSVSDFLVSNGIARERVTFRGLGESSPVAANSTVAGRQMNRRVEIIIPNEMQSQRGDRDRAIR